MELRNRMSIGFLFLNAVFIIILYALQWHTDTLYVTWPCVDNDGNIIKLDPLGFMFLIMFVLLMVIQIIGMILHRTSTFLHIMSNTVLTSASASELDRENTQNMIQLARYLGNLEAERNASSKSASTSAGGSMRVRRQRHVVSKVNGATVNAQFQRRWNDLKRNLADEDPNVDRLARNVLAMGGTMGRRSRRQAQAALRTLALRDQTQTDLQTIGKDDADTGSSFRGVRFFLGKDETQDSPTTSHEHHPTTSTTHHSTIPEGYKSTSRNRHRPTASSTRHQTYQNRGFTFPEPIEDYDSSSDVGQGRPA